MGGVAPPISHRKRFLCPATTVDFKPIASARQEKIFNGMNLLNLLKFQMVSTCKVHVHVSTQENHSFISFIGILDHGLLSLYI